MLFLHNRLEQADERSVHTGLWLQPPSIHHNQRQQSTQLGPRNTQGHGLIVNTVKTQREGGWTLGDDGNSESLGGVWGKIGEERGEEGQIDGSPISSLMVSKRGNMRECYPVKQVTQRKGGGSHTHLDHTHICIEAIKKKDMKGHAGV